MSQEPFDRIAQTASAPSEEAAPTSTPAPEFAPSPRSTTTATRTTRGSDKTAPAPAARDFDRLVRRAPLQNQTSPVAEAPAADSQTTEPRGQMIPTAAPGVIKTRQPVAQTPIVAPVKKIVHPRTVYIPVEICND